MTDGVHAAMQPVKPSPREAVVDCPSTEPERQQLWSADDAVLSARESGEEVIKVNRFGLSTPLARWRNRLRSCTHERRRCRPNRVLSMRSSWRLCAPLAHTSRMATRRLFTIPISHYCEKARWALDRAGVAYTEVPHLQGFHLIASKWAGGTGTTPVLVTQDAGVLGESADVVAYADTHGPPELCPYGDGPGDREQIFALQRDFDDDLGPHGRLWMYRHLLDRPDLAKKYGCPGVPEWERLALPPLFGVMGSFISRKL